MAARPEGGLATQFMPSRPTAPQAGCAEARSAFIVARTAQMVSNKPPLKATLFVLVQVLARKLRILAFVR